MLTGLFLTGPAAADPPEVVSSPLVAPEVHELMFENDSTDPAGVEFLDSAPNLVWCTDLADVAGYGEAFPMAPWATLYCLLEPGLYRIRIYQKLEMAAGESSWTTRVETVDVR